MRFPWSRSPSEGLKLVALPGRGAHYVRDDGTRFNSQGNGWCDIKGHSNPAHVDKCMWPGCTLTRHREK